MLTGKLYYAEVSVDNLLYGLWKVCNHVPTTISIR